MSFDPAGNGQLKARYYRFVVSSHRFCEKYNLIEKLDVEILLRQYVEGVTYIKVI